MKKEFKSPYEIQKSLFLHISLNIVGGLVTKNHELLEKSLQELRENQKIDHSLFDPYRLPITIPFSKSDNYIDIVTLTFEIGNIESIKTLFKVFPIESIPQRIRRTFTNMHAFFEHDDIEKITYLDESKFLLNGFNLATLYKSNAINTIISFIHKNETKKEQFTLEFPDICVNFFKDGEDGTSNNELRKLYNLLLIGKELNFLSTLYDPVKNYIFNSIIGNFSQINNIQVTLDLIKDISNMFEDKLDYLNICQKILDETKTKEQELLNAHGTRRNLSQSDLERIKNNILLLENLILKNISNKQNKNRTKIKL